MAADAELDMPRYPSCGQGGNMLWNRDLKHWHEAPREPESFSEAFAGVILLCICIALIGAILLMVFG